MFDVWMDHLFLESSQSMNSALREKDVPRQPRRRRLRKLIARGDEAFDLVETLARAQGLSNPQQGLRIVNPVDVRRQSQGPRSELHFQTEFDALAPLLFPNLFAALLTAFFAAFFAAFLKNILVDG